MSYTKQNFVSGQTLTAEQLNHITDGWGGDYTRITDVINRCKDKGYQFMTMGQAWAVRKPIYDWFAMMNG